MSEREENCALSWSGFNIRGDEKSVSKVRHLIDVAGRAAAMEEEVATLADEIAELRTLMADLRGANEANHQLLDRREARVAELEAGLREIEGMAPATQEVTVASCMADHARALRTTQEPPHDV